MEQLITKSELAYKLKISERSINRYMLQGMPYKQLSYKTIRFDLKEVNKWLKTKKNNI